MESTVAIITSVISLISVLAALFSIYLGRSDKGVEKLSKISTDINDLSTRVKVLEEKFNYQNSSFDKIEEMVNLLKDIKRNI